MRLFSHKTLSGPLMVVSSLDIREPLASGFGWDDTRCEVTASKEVWEQFLVSHPAARKFQNKPFSEWHDLAIVFGNAATGEHRQSMEEEDHREPRMIHEQSGPNRRALNRNNLAMRMTILPMKMIPPAADVNADETTPTQSTSTASQSGINASITNDEAVTKALQIYQDQFAKGLPQSELVAGFSVLEIPAKARVFVQIHDSYKNSWLKAQIQSHLDSTSPAVAFEDI
ncbi:hypothetical protein KEM48_007516 [Puccinia striiformis f. sp. tritici PST-130]|nr:hypothetical protein KEM48_007516 [Puccinia striiformis f. sp. tritici PST-130]